MLPLNVLVCFLAFQTLELPNNRYTLDILIHAIISARSVRGVARSFQRGDHSRDTIQGSPTIYGLYRCSLVYQRAQSYYRGMTAHIN